MPHNGIGIHPAIIDPRRGHAECTCGAQHLTLPVITIAHHQAPAILIDLTRELSNVGCNLGLKCRSKGAVADNLLEHRMHTRVVGPLVVMNYREQPSAPSQPARQRRS